MEHRDDLVTTRTQTVKRLRVLLTLLIPGGATRRLSADAAAQLLRTVHPRSVGLRTLRRLAADLIAELRHLDRASPATTEIAAALQATGSTLAQLRGIGNLTAGKIVARVGPRPVPLGRVRRLQRRGADRGVLW